MKEAQQAEYIQNTSTLIPVCVHTFPYRLHNINNRVTKNVTLLSSSENSYSMLFLRQYCVYYYVSLCSSVALGCAECGSVGLIAGYLGACKPRVWGLSTVHPACLLISLSEASFTHNLSINNTQS